ncbi:MAG: general secretion pathway protein GspB [Phycisphaerae bacterium]|nr:general secretion pathway protein GspB [Phycisphaerae bacterium]
MSQDPTRPNPLGLPADNAPVARPWRPELQPGAVPDRPWRPDMPAPTAAKSVFATPDMDDESALVSGDAPVDEQEMAIVGGGPTRIRASLSRANLTLFGLFVIGIAIVAFMSLKKGPQTVSASDKQASKKVDTAIDKFLQAQRQSPRAEPGKATPANGRAEADKLISDTRHLVEMFFNFTSKKQVPLENLRTNPFRFEDSETKQGVKTTAAQQADDAAKKKRLDKAKADFAKLRLQTILTGPAGRQAMINTSVLKVGDTIDGFTIEDIQPRSVRLSFEGTEFKLEMGF